MVVTIKKLHINYGLKRKKNIKIVSTRFIAKAKWELVTLTSSKLFRLLVMMESQPFLDLLMFIIKTVKKAKPI